MTSFENERKYWREMLKRDVATVKYLATHALAFRGKTQTFGESTRQMQNGNYIGALEYLSEFDPFLRAHVNKYANLGKGNTNYLSANICDEFIKLMGKKIRNEIVEEIIAAKFFTIILVWTPHQTSVTLTNLQLLYGMYSKINYMNAFYHLLRYYY